MHKQLNKLLVANRGEIAVRIIRAAQALGIPTVAVCSEADRDSLAARLADEVRSDRPCAGRAELPGYRGDSHGGAGNRCRLDPSRLRFLSENPAFAEAVQAAGLVFRRSGCADHPPHGRQGRGAAYRDGRRGAGGAGLARRAGRPRRGAGLRRRGRLSAAGQGLRWRRRAWHPYRPRRRRTASEFPSPSARRRPPSVRRRCTWSASSARRGTSKCRSSAMASARCICSNANARCSGGARRSSRRHLRRHWTARSARPSARAPCAWRRVSAIVARAPWNTCSTRTAASSLHRDEHPYPGRASGQRDGHRHRPGPGHAAHRRRRGAALAPGGHSA